MKRCRVSTGIKCCLLATLVSYICGFNKCQFIKFAFPVGSRVWQSLTHSYNPVTQYLSVPCLYFLRRLYCFKKQIERVSQFLHETRI